MTADVVWWPNGTATMRHAQPTVNWQTGLGLCGRPVHQTIVIGPLPKCRKCLQKVLDMGWSEEPDPPPKDHCPTCGAVWSPEEQRRKAEHG